MKQLSNSCVKRMQHNGVSGFMIQQIDQHWQGKVQTPVQVTKKVGRNDLCPCGSGKKYKNCCMKKEKMA